MSDGVGSSEGRQVAAWVRRHSLALVLGGFALLSLLALNPYFRPDYHDNITYFLAAESLLAGEGYSFQGAPIADWPPVTSLVLAAVFAFTGSSILFAKLVSVGAALVAIVLADRVLRREGRAERRMAIALFALTPVAVLTAATVASDWLCAALSFGCLLALARLADTRSIGAVFATGVLLGAAALTRQTGVLLGIAIVAQAAGQWRRQPTWRAVVPEAAAAALGAAMYLAWGWYTALRTADQPPLTGNYANHGLALFTDFSAAELALSVFDLLWEWDSVMGRLGVPGGVSAGLLLVPALLMLVGLVTQARRGGLRPTDLYALGFLLLIFGYHWKMPRYLLPVAPFLIAWLLTGMRVVAAAFAGGWRSPRGHLAPARDRIAGAAVSVAVAAWLCTLVAFDFYVLFNRSGNGSHRGFSPLASPEPAAFYQGEWADLHAACEAIRSDGRDGAVETCGFYLRYVAAFTGRTAFQKRGAGAPPAAYAVAVSGPGHQGCAPEPGAGDQQIFSSHTVTAWRRAGAALADRRR